MGAWGADQNVGDAILMLADGNGEFTASINLGMDGSGFRLGARSQRYSMIVKDGIVKQLNIEEPGQFEKSSAETLLAQL
jgi:peroxiredoxin